MRRALITLALCTLIGGCGGGGQRETTSKTRSATTPNPTAQLGHAVRIAIEQNATVSDYVLWHNAIPSWASQSTAGPALAGMRGSAAQRKTGGLRVRVLTGEVTIRSVELNPSYLSATASVVEGSRVRVYKQGHPERRTIVLKEPAQIELHRIGDETKFVVWKLAPAR
jgi:hypothetical protein